MKLLSAEQLKAVYRRVITTLGGSAEEADIFAETFVTADLRGMEWQGFRSLDRHIIDPLQRGIVNLGQPVTIEEEAASSFVLEARGELGQVACRRAMLMAIAKAEQTGCCAFTIRHCGDTGLLGAYTLLALEHDCVGLMFNNTNPYIAPWGGTDSIHGIDPLSIAVPTGEEPPVVLDMSVTPGRLNFDKPETWVRPFQALPVVPFATLREYLLSATLEAMVGSLTDMPLGRDKTRRGEAAVFGLAVHVPHFIGMEAFHARADAFVRQVKSSALAPGSAEILLPGERGFREQARRSVEGVPIADEAWDWIGKVVGELGIDLEAVVASPAP